MVAQPLVTDVRATRAVRRAKYKECEFITRLVRQCETLKFQSSMYHYIVMIGPER